MEISNTIENKEIKKIDRYPGPRPFDEIEKSMFFGRNLEIEEIFQSISVHNVFIIHGESGLGKSSLISAGLIPKLREKGYYPLLIRFKDKKKSPLQQVVEEIEKEPIYQDYSIEFNKDKIWHWSKLYNRKDITPILVFDQFEEFSYYDKATRNELIAEICTLISDRIPEKVINYLEENDNVISDFSWYSKIAIKIIFSLRSDALNILEEISKSIPSVPRNRFQLKPILLDQAEQPIVWPAMMDSSENIGFNSFPFQYETELLTSIIEVAKDMKTGVIETTQLQMICQEVEVRVKNMQAELLEHEQKNILVTLNDFGGIIGLKELVKNFYSKQLLKVVQDEKVHISKNEYFIIIRFIESKLLAQNKRVPLISESVYDYFQSKNIKDGRIKKILDLLLSLRLIRDVTYGNSTFYEISHDTFIEQILKEKKQREFDEKTKQEIAAAAKKLKEIEDQKRESELKVLEEKRKSEKERKLLELVALEQKKKIENQKQHIDEIEIEREKVRLAKEDALKALVEKENTLVVLNTTLTKLKRYRTYIIIGAVILFAIGFVVFLIGIQSSKNANLVQKLTHKDLSNSLINEAWTAYNNNEQYIAFRKLLDAKKINFNDSAAKLIDSLPFYAISANYIELSENHNILASINGDNSATIWKIKNDGIQKIKDISDLSAIRFSASGNYVVYANSDNTYLRILCMDKNNKIHLIKDSIKVNEKNKESSMYDYGRFNLNRPYLSGFSPKENYFFYLANHVWNIILLDSSKENNILEKRLLEKIRPSLGDTVTSIAFSYNDEVVGFTIKNSKNEKKLSLFYLANNKIIPIGSNGYFRFHPSSPIVCIRQSNNIKVLNYETGTTINVKSMGYPLFVGDKLLLLGDDDDVDLIIKLDTAGFTKLNFPKHHYPIYAYDFNSLDNISTGDAKIFGYKNDDSTFILFNIETKVSRNFKLKSNQEIEILALIDTSKFWFYDGNNKITQIRKSDLMIEKTFSMNKLYDPITWNSDSAILYIYKDTLLIYNIYNNKTDTCQTDIDNIRYKISNFVLAEKYGKKLLETDSKTILIKPQNLKKEDKIKYFDKIFPLLDDKN